MIYWCNRKSGWKAVEGSIVRFNKKAGRVVLPLVIGVFGAAVLFSCSGAPGSADDVVERMRGAYGGPEKIELLKSFVGRGFMKDQLNQSVIRYWPYDHFQRDSMVKTKVALMEKGVAYNIRFATFDGLNYRVAEKKGDMNYPLVAEIIRIEKRFPLILDWLRNSGLEGRLKDKGEKSGICRVEYTDTYDLVEIGVDRKEWLLRYVRFESRADSTRIFKEAYSDYWEVDGIPFPSRFTGTFTNNRPYYEYYFVRVDLGADLPDSTFVLSEEELALIPEKGTGPADKRE